jgi:hypothetical protein
MHNVVHNIVIWRSYFNVPKLEKVEEISLKNLSSLLSTADFQFHFCCLRGTSTDVYLPSSLYSNAHYMFRPNWPFSGLQHVCLRERYSVLLQQLTPILFMLVTCCSHARVGFIWNMHRLSMVRVYVYFYSTFMFALALLKVYIRNTSRSLMRLETLLL